MQVLSEFFTAAEVAERLGVTKVTVTNYIRTGRLPAQRVGQMFLVRKCDVEAFVKPAPVAYPAATRREAIRLRKQKLSYPSIAGRLEIPLRTIIRWTKDVLPFDTRDVSPVAPVGRPKLG